MSLSYTTRRNLFGNFTKNTTADNLSFGDTLMNQEEKRVINSRAWDFTQRTFPSATVASQQFYNLPVNYRKLIGNPTITVGSVTYTIPEAPDRATWDRLNSVADTSDVPQYFYIFNRQIGFYPTPASNSNVITLPYEIQGIDMSVADYSTGTITSIANGATTLEGNGTSWTAGMAGKYIKIDDDNTADSGDNSWYEISSVTDADTIELVIPYEGVAIAAATQTYTIAQLSELPSSYETLPVYKAAQQYWLTNYDAGKLANFKLLYDEMFKTMVMDRGTKTSDLSISEDTSIKNPNLYIRQ